MMGARQHSGYAILKQVGSFLKRSTPIDGVTLQINVGM